MTQNFARRIIPDSIKPLIRRIYSGALDLVDTFTGRQKGLTPPRQLIYDIGGGNFAVTGNEFLRYFIEFGDLQPGDCVLDVGCGAGRMAAPLTAYLSAVGEYRGFDIMKKGVAWCQKQIAPRFPNFHFQLADVYNGEYNPKGHFRASEYVFPYNNDRFDFVFLTSVFTHMLPGDMENYLSQLVRVLKPGKKCLITFFLLNPESTGLMTAGKSSLDFCQKKDKYYPVDSRNPEISIAYEEPFVRELFQRHGLAIIEPVLHGSWCGRAGGLSYQDMILAVKDKTSLVRATGIERREAHV